MLVWAVWCYPDTCLELLKVIWSWAVFPDVVAVMPSPFFHICHRPGLPGGMLATQLSLSIDIASLYQECTHHSRHDKNGFSLGGRVANRSSPSSGPRANWVSLLSARTKYQTSEAAVIRFCDGLRINDPYDRRPSGTS